MSPTFGNGPSTGMSLQAYPSAMAGQFAYQVPRIAPQEVAGIQAMLAQKAQSRYPKEVYRNPLLNRPDPIAHNIIANIVAAQAPKAPDLLQGRGKEAAAFALAYAFDTYLPDGWRAPTWRDSELVKVPGMKRGLRLPKVRPPYIAAAVNFGMVAVNLPMILTGHLLNDAAGIACAVMGITSIRLARLSLR